MKRKTAKKKSEGSSLFLLMRATVEEGSWDKHDQMCQGLSNTDTLTGPWSKRTNGRQADFDIVKDEDHLNSAQRNYGVFKTTTPTKR